MPSSSNHDPSTHKPVARPKPPIGVLTSPRFKPRKRGLTLHVPVGYIQSLKDAAADDKPNN
jgi:hypothetical protein